MGYILLIFNPVVLSQTKNTNLTKVRTCSNLIDEITLKKQFLSNNINESKLISANILSSLDDKIKLLDQKNKKTILLNKNVAKFNNDLDYLLLERENLLFKLEVLQKIECLNSKSEFLSKIKDFKRLYNKNIKRNNDLKRVFKLSVVNELNQLSEEVSNEK